MINKFRLLRRQKRVQRFLKNYHLLIMFTAFTFLSLAHVEMGKYDFVDRSPASATQKPASYKMPSNFQKARQSIEINADYNKLSRTNQIRITGKISSPIFQDKKMHYRWEIIANAKLVAGDLEGDIDMNSSENTILDIEVQNPRRPVKVKLEAYTFDDNKKYGSSKLVLLNPKDLTEEKMNMKSSQLKTLENKNLSKEERIKQELDTTPVSVPRQ